MGKTVKSKKTTTTKTVKSGTGRKSPPAARMVPMTKKTVSVKSKPMSY